MKRTIEIPVFPDGFYEFGDDAVDIDYDCINEWIKTCREKLEYAEDGEYAYCGSGNTFVIVMKHDDEYIYHVSKGYWEGSEIREDYYETRKIKRPSAFTARWRKWFRKDNAGELPSR